MNTAAWPTGYPSCVNDAVCNPNYTDKNCRDIFAGHYSGAALSALRYPVRYQ